MIRTKYKIPKKNPTRVDIDQRLPKIVTRPPFKDNCHQKSGTNQIMGLNQSSSIASGNLTK
ncbi:hypothetical protein AUJ42_02750 [Candidatus Collierbacteria bacterium CG1_02_44_10]|uniref:Uncharacterized protein n=1 Tax=Candidatus Collierbacteria bacterium CG1_02_44_10 TaxID=1805087 RepID=A0A1J4RV00_9BACT|nr:MAG: hypothetical protein AUJ42_02750 [Candidatus Collierbacteria bacterium CG1_02_44_10]